MLLNEINSLKEWVAHGRENNYKHIIIVFDSVDKDYFPHYISHDDIDHEWSKFISESKQKPIFSFNLNQKIKGVDF